MTAMFVEIRTYRLKNGGIPDYLKVVGETGIAIQKRHLGDLVGYFSSEIGSTQAVRYVEVPGRYDGNVPYKRGDEWFI